MSGSERREGAPRVIFAVDDEAERGAFSAAMKASLPGCKLFFPANIAEIEAIYSKDGADAIVTDLRFHGGALADWLTFWPLPAVIMVEPDDAVDRIAKSVSDEACLFIQRLPDAAHLRYLPLLVRKALNVRESTTRQNAYLQMSERQYMNLLQAIPDIVYILDGNGRFVYLNEAIRELGYEPTALIGKHFSEIVRAEDVPRVSREAVLERLSGMVTGDSGAPKLFNERRSGRRMTRNLEVRLRPADGNLMMASVNSYGEVNCLGYVLPEFEGVELGTVGIIRDITLRKRHEQDLEAALAAKELLLKEIHHRVKNNLQVVSSLLNIEESAVEDVEARKVFLDCQNEIQTMAMVHEALYRSSSFDSVEMQSYFERLLDYLSGSYDAAQRGISCFVSAGDISLVLDDAMPVALAVNELVANCMKHAFPAGRGGSVRVSLEAGDEEYRLAVEDDGIGFEADLAAGSGIGTELVSALASQLKGSIDRSAGEDGSGARVEIRFPARRAPEPS
jgi:PAS domain S-box-containing protein